MIFEMRLFLFFFLLCRKIPAGSPASWLVVRAMTSCCVSRFSNECARALHVYVHHVLHRKCAVLGGPVTTISARMAEGERNFFLRDALDFAFESAIKVVK